MGAEKLDSGNIPFRAPSLDDLFYFASSTNGLGAKNYLSALKTLIAASGFSPATEFPDIASLLSNTTIINYYFAYVADASGDPDVGTGDALYLYNGGDKANLESYILIKGSGIEVTNVDGGVPESLYAQIPALDGGGV